MPSLAARDGAQARGPDAEDGRGGTRADAFGAFERTLGREFVLTDGPALAPYLHATSAPGSQPLGVIRPGSTAEVTACVRIAAQFGIPLYPISRGKNWGYGDARPPGPPQVIVDLGRMDRIIEVNDELAYVVIEPGVTQGALSEHLAARHPHLWADCTGAGPDVSVVGNMLERGFGHTAYGNRFQTLCGLEVVLADGRILKTSFGHYAQSKAQYTFPYGVGPYLDGIFTQANFGIVTRVGLWLMPAPEDFELFVVSASDDGFGSLIESLRALRLSGTVQSVVHVGNDMRLITSAMTFPQQAAPGRSALPAAMRKAICAQNDIGAWTAVGALMGTRQQVGADRAVVKRALGRHRLRFVNQRKLVLGERVARQLQRIGRGERLTRQLQAARGLFDFNRGVPSRRFLAGAYWRRRGGLPADFPARCDPAADGCGLMWLAPALPATAEAARDLLARVSPILAEHDFDLLATLSFVNERSLAAVLTIAFDRSNPEESARAERCYATMLNAAMAGGYLPYRVGTYSMDPLANGSTVFWDVVATLKAGLDPAGIIAPGRYQPNPEPRGASGV
ncbi:MAG: FAD-binding oxidoreductase [Alphaproteobacteria bacterium]